MRLTKSVDGGGVLITHYEYFLMVLFFILSGFPAGGLIPYKTLLIGILGGHYFISRKEKPKLSVCLYLFSFVLVGILQKHTFGYSDMGSIFQMAFSAYFIAIRLGIKFRYAYLNVLYVFCIISIVFYSLMALFHVLPPDLFPVNGFHSVFVYNVRLNEVIQVRNCGPFWEPGAFAGYICILFILFFDKLPLLWSVHKTKVKWILLALVTTFSTQGYLIMFCIVVFYFLNKRFTVKTVFISFVLIVFVAVVVMSVPWLGEKVQEQLVAAQDTESKEGSTNLSRFSTAMIDIYYIMKHPVVGNTTLPAIRYSDHPYLRNMVEYTGNYGTGSGFTDFMATYGILPLLVWGWYMLKTFRKSFGKKASVFCLILLVALGNAECYFLWICYHVFPFLVLNKESKKVA